MPVWTAENDLKLATAIIALHQVKVNKGDCDRLAAIIGDGCTGKAITHRVQKFREAASQLNLGDGSVLPATPATGKKRARKSTSAEDQDADGLNATPTKKARTPKTKKKAADVEDDDAEIKQNIKAEDEGKIKKEIGDED